VLRQRGQCCGRRPDEVERMRQFGELTGIAFQIKDDLFDYGSGQDTGKPTGLDIKEKKLTLPLIHALQQVSERPPVDGGRGEEQERGHAAVARLGRMVPSGRHHPCQQAHATSYRDKALPVLHTFPRTRLAMPWKDWYN
jgi:octaprenyl-diphosphate synthase